MRLAGLLLAVLSPGCFSTTLPPRQSPELASRVDRPLPTPLAVHVDCVPGDDERAITCPMLVPELRKLLAPSPWFETLEADRDEATLILTVHATPRLAYPYKPAHNPALFLLSPVIPSWWTEPRGFRVTARNVGSGAAAEVDTTHQATTIMWGLAPLLNLLPDRGLRDTERERRRMQAQLLGVVGE